MCLYLCPAATSPNFQTNKSFLCGPETQLLDLKVHVTTAQGQSLVRNTHTHTHTLRQAYFSIGYYSATSSCCDWLLWELTQGLCRVWQRGVDCRMTKGNRDVEKISTCCRGYCAVFCHVSPYLHNWVHTSTKWRRLWRPADKEGTRQCYLSPVMSFLPSELFSVSVERNRQTDSLGSRRIWSWLPSYSL